MATLKEQLEELGSKRRRLAVWEMLHAHLDENFVPRDGGRAPKAIKLDDGDLVPEDIIEDVIQALGDGPIATLKGEISAIENQEVVVSTREASDG